MSKMAEQPRKNQAVDYVVKVSVKPNYVNYQVCFRIYEGRKPRPRLPAKKSIVIKFETLLLSVQSGRLDCFI